MYWEDVYSMFELASNMDTLHKNAEMRFSISLHAGAKALKSFEEMPLPYPDREWHEKMERVNANQESSTPDFLKKRTVKTKRKDGGSDRFKEVMERVRQTQQKALELEEKYGLI